jgi:hypothetical protein
VPAAITSSEPITRINTERCTFLKQLAAIGFWLWAQKMTDLHLSAQVGFVIMAGAGMGLMLGQASTDAVNRVSMLAYGEATGITQTVRNFAASLGIAVPGTILVYQLRSHLTASLTALGVPPARAAAEASKITQSQGGGHSAAAIPGFIRLDFAHATQTIFLAMAVVMAVAAFVALIGLRGGRQQEAEQEQSMPLTQGASI